MATRARPPLLLVHAHPDDESLSTGGTIARYADGGVHVCLVTCTSGEEGEVADVPDLGPPHEVAARLGEVRRDELRRACAELGAVDVRLLGYRDSGMAGTEANADPRAFVNQNFDEVVRRVVSVVRDVRPGVVVTYDERGLYGHPDHIRAHEVTMAALARAPDSSFAPELGPPHEVAKVYVTAIPRSFMRAARELASVMGMDPEGLVGADEVDRLGTPEELVTAWLDVRAYVERKRAALAAHRTQLGTTAPFLAVPEPYRELLLGTECYVRLRPVPQGVETDLYEGL